MATETLRPDGVGNYSEFEYTTPPNANWENLSDDSDLTEISSNLLTQPMDSHTYTNPSGALGRITNVTVKGRVTSQVQPAGCKFFLRISSTDYMGSTTHVLTGSFAEYTESWATNPDTSLPWTLTDVQGIECGIQKTNTTINTVSAVEMYCDVTHLPATRNNDWNWMAGSGML
jgi:hypothetical protein